LVVIPAGEPALKIMLWSLSLSNSNNKMGAPSFALLAEGGM